MKIEKLTHTLKTFHYACLIVEIYIGVSEVLKFSLPQLRMVFINIINAQLSDASQRNFYSIFLSSVTTVHRMQHVYQSDNFCLSIGDNGITKSSKPSVASKQTPIIDVKIQIINRANNKQNWQTDVDAFTQKLKTLQNKEFSLKSTFVGET